MGYIIIGKWSIKGIKVINDANWNINNNPEGSGTTIGTERKTFLIPSLMVILSMLLASCSKGLTTQQYQIIQTPTPITLPTNTPETTEPTPDIITLPPHILELMINNNRILIDAFGEPTALNEDGRPSYSENFRPLDLNREHPELSEIVNTETNVNVTPLSGLPFNGYLVEIGAIEAESQTLLNGSWNYVTTQMGAILDQIATSDNIQGADRVREIGGAGLLNELASQLGENNMINIHNSASPRGDNIPQMILVPPPSPDMDAEEVEQLLSPQRILDILLTETSFNGSMSPTIAMLDHMDPVQPEDVNAQLKHQHLGMSLESGGVVFFSPESRQIMLGINIPGGYNLLPDDPRYQNQEAIIELAAANEFTNIIMLLLRQYPELKQGVHDYLAASYGFTPQEMIERACVLIDGQEYNGLDEEQIALMRENLKERIRGHFMDEFTSSLLMLYYMQDMP